MQVMLTVCFKMKDFFSFHCFYLFIRSLAPLFCLLSLTFLWTFNTEKNCNSFKFLFECNLMNHNKTTLLYIQQFLFNSINNRNSWLFWAFYGFFLIKWNQVDFYRVVGRLDWRLLAVFIVYEFGYQVVLPSCYKYKWFLPSFF